ncbi:MAG: MEDS domain-containing protein, partial [Pseudonocardiaceae bacterium]
AELSGLDGVRQALDNGGVGVSSVDEFYSQSGVLDPVRAAEASVSASERTLAAGYTGFRAVVDATEMVRTPAQREVFARFEYLIDRKMSVLPVSALCAYDVGELGSAAVAEMACLHPLASAGSTLFRLYAAEGVDFALAGEIDLSCADLFGRTLGRTVPLSSGPELIVDARELAFIDHRGLLALAKAAQRCDATMILRDARHSVARVIELLELPHLQVRVTT